MSLQIKVYDSTDTFICNVPRFKNARVFEEHNTPGSWSFDIPRDDPILTSKPQLLNYGNIVRFFVDGVKRKACLLEGKGPVNLSAEEGGGRVWRLSGRGCLAWLEKSSVYPEYPLKRDTADERSFDYGSVQNPIWYDASQWHTPLGVAKSSNTSIRDPFPRDWPDSQAQWLWSSPGPNVDTPPGYNFFRGGFSLASETLVSIYAAGDDAMELQLDSEVILQAGYRQWVRPAVWTGYLSAGYHLLAAWVYNHGTSSGGNTAGGFICSVIKVDRNGKALFTIKRSVPSGFLVYNEANAPGWFPAGILKKTVGEAIARGCVGVGNLVFGFTDDTDYDGNAWLQRHNMSFPIATTNLLDLTARLCEHDFDVDVSPDLVLRAWRSRGVDRTTGSGKVVLTNQLENEATGSISRIRNHALVRHKRGWMQVVDSTSESTWGRCETGLTLGNAGSDAQADRTARASFEDTKDPEVTISVQGSSVKGPQPWANFDMYDLLWAQGLSGNRERCRVMNFALEQSNETSAHTWSADLYPDTA